MLVTNNTNQDYWVGPLLIPAGVGGMTIDDTSSTSLYLTDDVVADAINTLQASGKISVSGAAAPFPRPTGEPEVLHGDGNPEGLLYAGQGSAYLRRDTGTLYTKTTGIHLNTGWVLVGSSGNLLDVGNGTEVINTATETSLYSYTVPGGTLGAHGGVRMTLMGDFLYNSGISDTLTIRIKFGATTLYTTPAWSDTVWSANRYPWRLQVLVANTGVSNVQTGYAELFSEWRTAAADSGQSLPPLPVGTTLREGSVILSSAEDTTSDKSLNVTAKWSNARTTESWRPLRCMTESA
jgi:hypothetical protein